NQKIFSGVGNIIKNEALYRAKIHPLNKVKDIPDSKLKLLIKQTRGYAFDFLEWKKAGTLKKHWEVYSKKVCPLNHDIEKKEIGDTKRQTYYCNHCQKRYLEK
ncbi:MAG: endonuclease, partial [Pedobacter sp.]